MLAKQPVALSRRRFLKAGAAVGGGLLLSFQLAGCEREARSPSVPTHSEAVDGFVPNAYVRIDHDGAVMLMVPAAEMGQGVMTALPTLLAEELEVDPAAVRLAFAPVHPAYANPETGRQATGGSNAVRGYWKPLREAGATAREMLVAAAAQRWGVAPAACRAELAAVLHPASGQRLTYGELAGTAARLPVPDQVALKPPERLRLIGRHSARLDIAAKVDGSARFGQDVQRPGMAVAVLARCPVFGGRLAELDEREARKVPGVRQVLKLPEGVAVVADSFPAAQAGRQRLALRWSGGEPVLLDDAGVRYRLHEALERGGAEARTEGDAAAALAATAPERVIRAEYFVPYQAHACMEPLNCTVEMGADGCDLWLGTQAPDRVQATAAALTGLPPAQVRVHNQFLGGGFGRRGEQDFVVEAVRIAMAVGGPVKLMWSREDDLRHDFYRPAALHRFEAALDGQGLPTAWRHTIASPSILSRIYPAGVRNGIDGSSTSGATALPYAIPNLQVRYALAELGVPVGFWRSVGHSQNVFAVEAFLDQLAFAGGHDPYALRRELLQQEPRLRQVLDLAASRADWGEPLPAGWGRGIAVAASFRSFVAQVAEVSVEGDRLRVHRVVCAIDCGQVVNPDIVKAQMEGSVAWGLSAALKPGIALRGGQVQQSNFHDAPLLRFDEMPDVEVHIVTSDQPPGGVGEPGVPPVAAAVANAVFAATGRPVRELPIVPGASA